MKKSSPNDHIVLLANNVMGYIVGDDFFMTIKELHSGYNRMYLLTDHNGTHALSRPLAINELADFVDGVVTIAWKIRRNNED